MELLKRHIVCAVWQHIEEYLGGSSEAAVAQIRCLTAALPPLQQLSSTALRDLARLHLKSSGDLMKTLRVLVPGAFTESSSAPNMETILSAGDSILGMLSNLVELQMFHLLRAQAITAQLRMRLGAEAAAAVPDPNQYGAVSSSECDSTTPVNSLE